MASGHPDWGQAQSTGLIATVSDLGELAARLGSPDTYIRTGNVLYYTDWRDSLGGWSVSLVGTGALGRVLALNPFRGDTTLNLVCGSGAGGQVSVAKSFVPAHIGRVGLECMFALNDGVTLFTLTLIDFGGVSSNAYRIRYNSETQVLAYQSSDGTYVTIASDLNLRVGLSIYHLLKLVIDLSTSKYVRAILDHVTYSLTSIAPFPALSATSPSVEARLIVESTATANDQVNVDCVIFTINEP